MREMCKDVTKHYDVLVIGGGLAGVCAAVAAARHGAKTAIVQDRPMFGGMSSSEQRQHVVGASCHNTKRDVAETGIIHEILLANKARNERQAYVIWDSVVWEIVRYQPNLDMYLNTTYTACQSDGKRVTGVTCYQMTTEVTYHFTAKVYIDSTGNGTLGRFAGADWRSGEEGKNEFNEPSAPDVPNEDTQGSTMMYKAMDYGEPVQFTAPKWAYKLDEEYLKHRPHGRGVFGVLDGGEQVDGYDGQGTANANVLPQFSAWVAGHWWNELGGKHQDIIGQSEEIRDELMKYMFGIWDHIKNFNDHGAATYDLEWVGYQPGCRESRRFEGDYMLTENDVREHRIFEDAVAYGGWPMDKHVTGGIAAPNELPARFLAVSDGIYTIPYRCYYSRNIDNLMFAGRDISVSSLAFGSTRVMATCAVGGQAVGTAAALAVKYGCTPRGVGQHIKELQQALIKDDCFIPGYQNEDPGDLAHGPKVSVSATSFLPGCEPENVVKGLPREYGGQSNMWQSDGLDNAVLTVNLGEKKPVKEMHIVFDSNLNREIMCSIFETNTCKQPRHTPVELVKDFEVTFYCDGQIVDKREYKNNCQRHNVIAVKQEGLVVDQISIKVNSTNGTENARIFEVRLY